MPDTRSKLALFMAFAASIGLASCSASVSSVIRADGKASLSIAAEVPGPLAAKFRKLAAGGAGTPSTGPLFDAAAIRASVAARPYLRLIELSQPSPDSIRAEIAVRSLDEMAASPDIASASILTMTRGPGWAECRVRLERGGAKALAGLFPGIDPYLMEALSPPALDADPVTSGEYASMLRSVLGEKAMPAMEAATVAISITAPGTVIDSGGGSLSGATLTAKIALLQALALEKPIALWIRWIQY